jgi:hypothetical protein
MLTVFHQPPYFLCCLGQLARGRVQLRGQSFEREVDEGELIGNSTPWIQKVWRERVFELVRQRVEEIGDAF